MPGPARWYCARRGCGRWLRFGRWAWCAVGCGQRVCRGECQGEHAAGCAAVASMVKVRA